MADSTPDIQAALDRALARIDELEAENARLRERLQKLEHKLGRNSSNSHRPPSTDDPWEEDSGEKNPGEKNPGEKNPGEKNPGDADGGGDVTGSERSRQQGAQPGHEGHHRELLDEDEVDEVVEVKPSQCSSCGTRLCGEDKAPWRHQVFDVEVTRHVTEYQMHRLDCEECGRSERAALPEGVCQSAFGGSVCGWVSWLSGKFDLSKRDLERLVEQGFEIPISLGSICRLERPVQRALDSAHSEAVEALGDADVLWIDETGWFEQNERRWLWGAVGDEETPVTAFRIDPSRSREASRQPSGLVDPNFEGIVSSDRYSAYNGREPGKRQICWQHLVRDFRGYEPVGSGWPAMDQGPIRREGF
jgi:transposase